MEPKRKAAANIFMEQNALQDQGEGASEQEYAPLLQQVSQSSLSPPAAPSPAPYPEAKRRAAVRTPIPQSGLKTSEELQLEKEPIRVRETGFWFWRRVIVPPNAYVVHTRIGRKEPVTLGLGLSFRYNRHTDAYLVVPAAMQTIGVVAYCISKEKQGINILAYVQWQIHDFSVAYRKLDFSDSRDPLGIVNAQLREQAEAAIKDKIATMSVEEVLTDKEPIIEELTTRLKTVSEGRNQSDQAINEGLGIKIVTVQIKEALVSSQRLWQDLQAPFRYEQEKTARISYLQMQDLVRKKELETRQLAETREAETLVEIERIKQTKQTEGLEARLVEEGRRFRQEQESTRQKIQLQEDTTILQRESALRLQQQEVKAQQEQRLAELQREQEAQLTQARLDAEASARRKSFQVEQALQSLAEENRLADFKLQSDQQQLARESNLKQQEAAFKLMVQEQANQLQAMTLEADLARKRQETLVRLELEEAANRMRLAFAEKELEISRGQQEVRNLMNERDLMSRLIDKLPELAAHMPEIHELKVLQTGNGDGFDSLALFLTKLLALGEGLGLSLPSKQ